MDFFFLSLTEFFPPKKLVRQVIKLEWPKVLVKLTYLVVLGRLARVSGSGQLGKLLAGPRVPLDQVDGDDRDQDSRDAAAQNEGQDVQLRLRLSVGIAHLRLKI